MDENDLHAVLASFSPEVLSTLRKSPYFHSDPKDLTESQWIALIGFLPGRRLYETIKRLSVAKNELAWPIVFELYSLDGIRQGAATTAKILSLPAPEVGTTLQGASPWVRRYFEEKALKLLKADKRPASRFAADLTRTDINRLRVALWKHAGLNERDFQRMMKREDPQLAYIFDTQKNRIAKIKRTETARAAQGGGFNFAKYAGAEKKIWRTARDSRVRASHRIEGETRPIDEAFSNGRMYPSDPNERCHLEYSF
jgi:hypothetical protein